MNENKNEYTLLDKILMTLIFCSTLFSIGTEFYLFIIPRNRGLTFSEFKPFQQKLYIGLFISLFIIIRTRIWKYETRSWNKYFKSEIVINKIKIKNIKKDI